MLLSMMVVLHDGLTTIHLSINICLHVIALSTFIPIGKSFGYFEDDLGVEIWDPCLLIRLLQGFLEDSEGGC